MSYNYEFISNLKQIDQDSIEELDRILLKNAKKSKKVLEIGTYAGYVTLLLAGHTENVTTIDYDKFVSPSIDDHIRLNSLYCIKSYKGDDLIRMFDYHCDDSYDIVYVGRPVSVDEVKALAAKKTKNELLIISYKESGSFDIHKIEPVVETVKKTTRKTNKAAKTEDVTKSV